MTDRERERCLAMVVSHPSEVYWSLFFVRQVSQYLHTVKSGPGRTGVPCDLPQTQ